MQIKVDSKDNIEDIKLAISFMQQLIEKKSNPEKVSTTSEDTPFMNMFENNSSNENKNVKKEIKETKIEDDDFEIMTY